MSVVIYTTSITLPARQRTQQEYLIRTLSTLRIPYVVADVSMDEDAKRLWRRKGRTDGKLPGFLVDGEYVGSFEDYEYAVEDGRVPDFLGVPPPGPAAPVPPRTYTGIPTPPPPTSSTSQDASSTGESSNQGTEALSTSTKREPVARDEEMEQILEGAGEDELEKLLRELEG